MGGKMTDNNLQIEISDLTELDRLELEESLGQKLKIESEATSVGHLGEPGLLKAIIEVSQFAMPVIGSCLAIFLARGGNTTRYKDKLVIKNKKGSISRTVKFSSAKHDAISAEVMKQINDFGQEIEHEENGDSEN
jgi:hypothetical protein